MQSREDLAFFGKFAFNGWITGEINFLTDKKVIFCSKKLNKQVL